MSRQHLMRITFRTDASVEIGTGHVMRCLTLADALRERGADCAFICRPHTGHLLDLIGLRGHKAVALPALIADATPATAEPAHAAWLGTDWRTDAEDTRRALGNEAVDWLMVDHYALDARWEQALRPNFQRLMVIDDLADRQHDCDLLLDQNLGRTEDDYGGLLRTHTTTLIGPRYALLRPEFARLRPESLARRAKPQLKRLLITMGGVDKGNATGQVLRALMASALPSELHITVVMGPHAPWPAQVQALATQMPWPTQVLLNANNMAQLMTDSDLAIGAAGSTSWERCCLGVPTIQLVLADNQRGIADALVSVGAVKAASTNSMTEALSAVLAAQGAPARLQAMSLAASEVADGLGAERVANHLGRGIQ